MKSIKTDREIKRILEDAPLGIYFPDDSKLFNPLEDMPEFIAQSPELFYTWVLSKPEYFWLTCKILLNVDIHVMQGVILQNLWKHKFPMLVGSRGMGKSFILAVYALLRIVLLRNRKVIICGSGFRQSKIIFGYMEAIRANSSILRNIIPSDSITHANDGYKMECGDSFAMAIPIGCMKPDTIITTKSGVKNLIDLRQNENSNLIWTVDGFKRQEFFYDSGMSPAICVKTKKGYEYTATPNHMIKIVRNNEIVWCRTDELCVGDFTVIDRHQRWGDEQFVCTNEQAYALGLMIGDGTYTKSSKLRYTSIDTELHKAVCNIGDFRLNKDGVHADFTKSTVVRAWLDFWKLTPAHHNNKFLPATILSASKEAMKFCLRGLFDTDGHCSILSKDKEPSCVIGYTTTSQVLARQLHTLLLNFGVVSTLSSRDRNSPRSGLPAKRCYEINIRGINVDVFQKEIGFSLRRKQDILDLFLSTRKRAFSIDDIIPISRELVPKSLIKGRKNLTFPRAIDSGFKHNLVNENYFYDHVVSISKCIVQPMYDINIPDGNEYTANGFLSHNTGDKIRGLRANDVISDEFASVPVDIFETVIQGFAAVASSPTDQAAIISRTKAATYFGFEFESDDSMHVGNQIIVSGTAFYSFNHFAAYHEKYKKFIKSQGDEQKIV